MLIFAWSVLDPPQTLSFLNALERKLGESFLKPNNPLGRNSADPYLVTLGSPWPGRR